MPDPQSSKGSTDSLDQPSTSCSLGQVCLPILLQMVEDPNVANKRKQRLLELCRQHEVTAVYA